MIIFLVTKAIKKGGEPNVGESVDLTTFRQHLEVVRNDRCTPAAAQILIRGIRRLVERNVVTFNQLGTSEQELERLDQHERQRLGL